MSVGVTQRELQDVNTEFTRLNLQLEICSLSHEVKSQELVLNDSSRKMMTAASEELSSGKRIEDGKLDELMENVATIR